MNYFNYFIIEFKLLHEFDYTPGCGAGVEPESKPKVEGGTGSGFTEKP